MFSPLPFYLDIALSLGQGAHVLELFSGNICSLNSILAMQACRCLRRDIFKSSFGGLNQFSKIFDTIRCT